MTARVPEIVSIWLVDRSILAVMGETMPEDAKEAFGHGIRAKRSKSGAVSFEVIDVEANRASVE
jgi:hypothetical protein